MPLPGHIILAVGIDHGMGLRKFRTRLVVIDNDGRQAKLRRMGQGIVGEYAAVERQQQLRALIFELACTALALGP